MQITTRDIALACDSKRIFDPSVIRLSDELMASSVNDYCMVVKRYLAFCQERGIDPVDAQALKDWRGYIVPETMHSPNTINTYLFAVKRFVREAHENRYIDDTLYAQFKAVRTVKLSANVGRLKPNARVRIGRQTMHELGVRHVRSKPITIGG